MTEIPMVIVRACGRALPRLEAEESLLAADRASVGSGRLSRANARAFMDDWRRIAFPASGPRPRAARATPEQLAAMGIGYIIEPPNTP